MGAQSDRAFKERDATLLRGDDPAINQVEESFESSDESLREPLSFESAIRIAKGCVDYGGGYRSHPENLQAFHHGIKTVVRALEGAAQSGMTDLQSRVLHEIGGKLEADATSNGVLERIVGCLMEDTE